MSESLLGTASWHSLADGGIEHCSLWQVADGYRLEGMVNRFHEGMWRLDYRLQLAPDWMTRQAALLWESGTGHGEMLLAHDGNGNWRANGSTEPGLAGCTDVDFGFSPVTNLMPVRRLGNTPEDRVDVKAAWLVYPEMTLRAASQSYTRLGDAAVRYESSSGYRTDLEIDRTGFVTDYPGLWKRVTA